MGDPLRHCHEEWALGRGVDVLCICIVRVSC